MVCWFLKKKKKKQKQKQKNRITKNPKSPLLGTYLKELKAETQTEFLYPCSQQHYSQGPKMKATHVSISRWMDLQWNEINQPQMVILYFPLKWQFGIVLIFFKKNLSF